jgi:hypothetical protein
MELWIILAFIFSFCGALIIGFNHWAHLDGTRLVALRGLGILPISLTAFLLFPWPTHLSFYAVAMVMGAILALSDKLLFNAAHTHGGRLASLYIPIKMLMGFTLWALFQPSSLLPILTPLKITGIAGGFLLCTYAMLAMRHEHASRAALIAIIPVAALLALADVVSKEALNTTATTLAEIIGSATAFVTVTTTVGSLAGFIMGGLHKFGKPTSREVLLSAAFGALLMLGISLLLVTLALSPNPGYVGAITMLSSLWLAIHGYFHHKERTNWWAGLALLAGAILVAVAAA